MCRKCSNSITKAVEVRDLCIKSDKALKSSLPKKTQMVEVIVEVERHEIKAEYLETYLEDFASDNDNFPSPETTSQAVDTKPEIKVEDDSDDSMEDNLLALLGEKEEDLIIPVKKPPRKRSKPLPKPPKIDDDGVVVKKKKKPMDPAREYSFQCLFCGKFMKTPSSLKTHEHVVHQEHFVKPTESLKCICDLCGAVLGKVSILIQILLFMKILHCIVETLHEGSHEECPHQSKAIQLLSLSKRILKKM